MKSVYHKHAVLFFAAAFSLFSASDLHAEVSKFRKDFKTCYEQNRFDSFGFLVRTNKTKMPGEISGLINEAMLTCWRRRFTKE